VLLFWISYAKLNFYRDPGSRFYDESRAFDKRYTEVREREANEYLRTIETYALESDPFIKAGANPMICGIFVSAVRPGNESYLAGSVASALDKLTPAERGALHLTVFFPSSRPHEHNVFQHPWLTKVVDGVHTYESALSSLEIENARELESTGNVAAKQPFDYTLALRQCQKNGIGAKYIAIFEDDIIFAEGWLSRSILSLREVEQRMKDSKREDRWLYLRLFNQERSTGWASKEIGGNREFEISIGIWAVVLVAFATGCRLSRTVRASVDSWSLFVSLIFVPLFMILFFQCGKASMLPPKPGVREEAFGCCAQALLFNAERVEGLAEYIMLHASRDHYDMLTRDYARQHGLARWTQYPVMVQHIGKLSTIQTESWKVWSMAFEALDHLRLEREHIAHVGKAFHEWN